MLLSPNKISYVLTHLGHHIPEIDRDNILVLKESESVPENTSGKLIFSLRGAKEPEPVMVTWRGKKIPVLFGQSHKRESVFQIDQKGNVIFHHDLLSSAFYLLSGQQEYEANETDQFGRFPYNLSIQKKLNCVHLPLVNYYFEMILEGLEAHAQLNNSKIRRRKLFDNFGFFLSHDVDRVAFYHPFNVLYKIKQIIGLAPVNYSKIKAARLFCQGVFYNLNPFRGEDPWWNFDWMMNLEKRLGIRSTFFFLKQEDRFDNSLYKYHYKKIKNLITKVSEDGFEAGLHGTMRSAIDAKNLLQQKSEFSRVTGIEPVGIRQHYLRFSIPLTFKNQQGAGFKYDTSLAFAEHDGYRNGYCWPFHPFDFENDKMMPIWEIPLVMMEVSVLNYRKAGFTGLQEAVAHYTAEAEKFGGIFSLLWHNCRLSDIEIPGVTEFYEHLLKEIMQHKPQPVRGIDIYRKINAL
ncbi:MAG: hypothetical protein PWQ06_2122 [Anaerophaga sp.]|nr:hypothetical protein [Anaerophaga sp.]